MSNVSEDIFSVLGDRHRVEGSLRWARYYDAMSNADPHTDPRVQQAHQNYLDAQENFIRAALRRKDINEGRTCATCGGSEL